MRRTRLLTTTAAIALLLAACGSDGGDGTDAAGDGDGAGSGESADGGGDGDRLSFDDSPLAEAVGGTELLAPDTDEFETQQIAAEEAVRECMAEQGFEYTPNVGQMGDIADFEAQFDDPVGYARESGFGIAESLEATSSGGQADPNEAYVESLDESAQEAYYAALYGDEAFPSFDVDEDGNPVDEDGNPVDEEEAFADFEPSGCQAEAFEEAFSQGIDFDSEAFQRLTELYTELEERIEADPRIQELQDQYETCMADTGYDEVDAEEDAYELVFDKQQELDLFTDPFAGLSEEEMAELSEDEMQALSQEAPEPDGDALAELRTFEVDVAVANAECNEPIQQERLQIQFEAEQELVDDPANAELLEQVRAQLDTTS